MTAAVSGTQQDKQLKARKHAKRNIASASITPHLNRKRKSQRPRSKKSTMKTDTTAETRCNGNQVCHGTGELLHNRHPQRRRLCAQNTMHHETDTACKRQAVLMQREVETSYRMLATCNGITHSAARIEYNAHAHTNITYFIHNPNRGWTCGGGAAAKKTAFRGQNERQQTIRLQNATYVTNRQANTFPCPKYRCFPS